MNRRAFLSALGAFATQQKFSELSFSRLVLQVTTPSFTVPRLPYVQNIRDNRASILWSTVEAGVGTVQFSADGINFNTVTATSRFFSTTETGMAQNFWQYQADLSGLLPNTNYAYNVMVSGQPIASAGSSALRTAGPGPFNFLVLGDSGWGIANQTNEQNKIAGRMYNNENPALVLHVGDLVYNPSGTYDSYQRNYFNYYAATMSSTPFFPCPGNHDYEVQNGAPFIAVHSVPTDGVPPPDRGRYYSFDWGNVHFVAVDVMLSLDNAINNGGPMLRWLDNDLRSTRQFWKVVYFHQPPFAKGPNEYDLNTFNARQYVVPILDANGVQIVFSGHEHSYQRSVPIRKSAFVDPGVGTSYFTSGGGGALLYDVAMVPMIAAAKSAFHYLRAEVQGTQITMHSIGYDGAELDVSTIAPVPVFSDDPAVPQVTLSPGPVAGATIRIIGRNLAAEETFLCSTTPLTQMAGTVVTVNGVPIQLLYVSPTQIYGQLPASVSGNVTVRVTTANGFIEKSV
jgi:calcineurin-like phosphoesterase family protein/IPT/TIG domain-containing protein